MLTDKEITKYQKIYKKRFGKEISKKDALEQGMKLITLIKTIYKPNDGREERRKSKDL